MSGSSGVSGLSGLVKSARMSELATGECAAEIRAACRLPIDESALETVLGWHRSEFERILDRPDGGRRWAEFGQRLRTTSRHIGALADFFGDHGGVTVVGIEQLTQAVKMARADCTVRAARTPVAFEFCHMVPVDSGVAEQFLRAIAAQPEQVPALAAAAG